MTFMLDRNLRTFAPVPSPSFTPFSPESGNGTRMVLEKFYHQHSGAALRSLTIIFLQHSRGARSTVITGCSSTKATKLGVK
jgi:hypothetical protein